MTTLKEATEQAMERLFIASWKSMWGEDPHKMVDKIIQKAMENALVDNR